MARPKRAVPNEETTTTEVKKPVRLEPKYITPRQLYAASALGGFISNPNSASYSGDFLVQESFAWADKMIEYEQKKGP